MPSRRPRAWLWALLGTASLVAVCAAYVDRPLARWAQQQFRGTRLYSAAAGAFRLLAVSGAVALAFVLVSALWRRVARHEVAWRRPALRYAASGTCALVAAVALKFAIGRSQVDPAFLVDGIYALRPFHGGISFGAFPSAMTTVVTAVLTVGWDRGAASRARAVAGIAAVGGALIVTNGHWLGDIIGGAFLGAVVGRQFR